MKELASNDEGDIFVTDDVLAALMCTTRSINPWDIVATKKGTKSSWMQSLEKETPQYFFSNPFHHNIFNNINPELSVNENSLTPPEDSDSSTTIGGVQTNINPFNTASALSNEAELINSRFAQQSIYSKVTKQNKSNQNKSKQTKSKQNKAIFKTIFLVRGEACF